MNGATGRFVISPADIRWLGAGLHRPECVLATASGRLWVSDWRGGVTGVKPGHGCEPLLASPAVAGLRPNGIALRPDGSFLLACLGEFGGIWQLYRDGRCEPFCTRVEGRAMPPTNFVHQDGRDRVWVCVSTRQAPRHRAWTAAVRDGFIAVAEPGGDARIVADGLGYTNEMLLSPDGSSLYVNETFARRLTRFDVGADGSLSGQATVARFGEGDYPDGLAMDETGALWVVSIVSNRLYRVSPSGEVTCVLEDADADSVAAAEQAYRCGTMERRHLDTKAPGRLPSLSSIAFGGADRRTAYFGCLLGERIASVRMPVAGVRPVHWHWDEAG